MTWQERYGRGLVYGIFSGAFAWLLMAAGIGAEAPAWYYYGVGSGVGYAIGLLRDD